MRNIIVYTLPHKYQRYDTAGDYFIPEDSNQLYIGVSRMGNDDYEFLVALHEFIESYLIEKRGIKEKDITKFDIESNDKDPGSLPKSPYHKEHMFSERIEKLVSLELDVDWDEYNKVLDGLVYDK
jgi:hypothetical protein